MKNSIRVLIFIALFHCGCNSDNSKDELNKKNLLIKNYCQQFESIISDAEADLVNNKGQLSDSALIKMTMYRGLHTSAFKVGATFCTHIKMTEQNIKELEPLGIKLFKLSERLGSLGWSGYKVQNIDSVRSVVVEMSGTMKKINNF